ncbi:unnamed protein product [Nippostrongylus brasiliensis]|uniref:Peptidase M1 membrane alanine aminopeptidase domain-containing protein n=1 Tax=Nippostrongylus brasiliensis TaxID=27835 RepID=A0A3P7AW13_NIPBR|nr:unnamed protein product [Nippostrongylus brasiliensis]
MVGQTSFGVTVRVHASTLAVSRRVLDIALAAFELLANIMEITLPLNKIDFVLVPKYDGGMENWGLVMLSENLASTGDDAHLTYVVAHELAHHWIGDKATVNSWRWICLQVSIFIFRIFLKFSNGRNTEGRSEQARNDQASGKREGM